MSENNSSGRQARTGRRPASAIAPWVGTTLILLGLFFALRSIGLLGQHFRWWALFILFPALGMLGGTWILFLHSGNRFHGVIRAGLGSGAIVLTVALMLLFGMNWGLCWPLMLLVPGLAILTLGLTDPQAKRGAFLAGLANMCLWIGASLALLGLVFLASNLAWVQPGALLGAFPWWGIFILIPGLGALYNAFVAFRKSGNAMGPAAQGLLAIGLTVCAVAVVALFDLDWSLLTPLILIGLGLASLCGTLVQRDRPIAAE